MDRRALLGGLAATGGLGLAGCTTAGANSAALTSRPTGPTIRLAPLRAEMGRVFDISVCLRPFRPAGPRLDTEQVGDTLVVHNYGHGGSGWSLSWGSSAIAARKALAGSPSSVAVLGCGPLGMTSAILAQSAGAKVTIYARETMPDVPSIRATGSFTPDSRIALADHVDAGFPDLWEQMARTSLKRFGSLLGLAGDPVRWTDRYLVSDGPPAGPRQRGPEELQFASYFSRLRDVFPRAETLPPGATPFGDAVVRRESNIMFNLASYTHTLLTGFRGAGGRIEQREFHTPADLAALPEKVVINCTGLGSKALFGDQTMVPVRGQIAWLIPQREFDYGLYYRGVNVNPRTDGICVQAISGGDMRGYGDDSLAPNRQEAEESIASLAALYAKFGQV
ncbi:FAD-dependent oxidoreductase [Altererythrobacter sp. Root672]|uniref:FAD-dependent oxidoreductase n=1 Tax=Altererythrobacter sp. Root672 TaxID=1736584 RepID=UPI000701F3EE|nr:FAD-dependent oxidoreductase [Altererythrobacter sp. Root672]KRA81457.1 D-amino acid oxidase [Altererythrobacter sp. Root672]